MQHNINEKQIMIDYPAAVYVHIPFCRAKCFYCDFNSYPDQENLYQDYVAAVKTEVQAVQPGGGALNSVYFGGGTPTVLPAGDLIDLLNVLDDRFGFASDIETTIEANPGTIDAESLRSLHNGGFNRLSIGIQSFDDTELKRLGRIHTASDVRTAFLNGRNAGFSNISIDLMYALPDQSLESWLMTLKMALDLAPEHISLYELSVEEGTVFGNLKNKCAINLPDEDLQIKMYSAAIQTLTSAGYEHYEISNFALPGCRSKHNQVYWRNEPYYGFGAGASGYINGTRYTNVRNPKDYIGLNESGKSTVESSETLSERQAMGETVMLGLRMFDGVDLAAFRERFGTGLTEVYKTEINDFTTQGLLELTKTHLRLTQSGLLIANEISAEFL